MGISTGTATINASLLDALVDAGVADHDARELARLDAFGSAPVDDWVVGLEACARQINKDPVTLDWSQLPAPWEFLGPQLAADGADPQQTLLASIAPYDEPVRLALLVAIAGVAQRLAEQAAATHRIDPTKYTPSSSKKKAIEQARYLRPIDADLVQLIQYILHEMGGRVEQRRKVAGEQLVEWLVTNGRLIRTAEGRRYYLHRPARKLYALDSEAFSTFLYLATGVNPASPAFRYFLADCLAAALDGEQCNVVRVCHWDTEQEVLRVSRFDGTVYRLDGMTIATEANGDGPVVFDDSPVWMPYQPSFDSTGALEWSLTLPHWSNHSTELSQLYRTWWLATFFPELNPTKPVLVLKGEKGSGKTMALRVMLQLIFGPLVDVTGVPDKPDAFAAMASNSHISVMDNMDTVTADLRDKIAALATGKQDQVRELYTTNEVRTITYRAFLAVTSRTPDTLQRDDLADRLLLLPVDRLSADQRVRESLFLQQVAARRNAFWGELLQVLNAIVAEIRAHGLPDRGGLRMEDWAAFGSAVAAAEDTTDVWETAVKLALSQQADFLLEDNVVAQGIEAWIESPHFTSLWLPTRAIYGQCQEALFGTGRPDSNWPRSAKSFGRLLVQCRDELRAYLRQQGILMEWQHDAHRNSIVYWFGRSTP
jgi:hypothetical protein